MKRVAIQQKYPSGHFYIKEYEKTEWHCMNCGIKEVWDECGEGDYYLGTASVCLVCGQWGHYMDGTNKRNEMPYEQTLEELRNHIKKD